jgi:hypothetical protein
MEFFMRRIAAVCIVVLLSPATYAQNASALINEALDKQVALDLNGTLPAAVRAIGEKTGVTIEASPIVWDLLPWGEQTNITAKIEGQTLRDALDAITRKLGLTFAVKEHVVELQPMPALRRLGRRATVKELQALDLLASNPANVGSEQPTVRQLVESIDKRLLELKSPFAIENRPGNAVPQDQPVFVARNATLLDALESLVKETALTWYPWDQSIVIVPKQDQVRNQLARLITVRYNGVEVHQVLVELAQRSGVEFILEPGAVQRIPPEFRTLRLQLNDVSVQQAIESIAAFTGLNYNVTDRGVYVWNPSTTPGVGARDPIVGMVQLDSGMQLLIPQSQVPADVQEYLKLKMRRELAKIREMMQEEGFKPATQPTTRPADGDL